LRSPREIAFRIKQEAANIWLAIAKPAISVAQDSPLDSLPQPGPIVEKLRGTAYAAEIERLARTILQGRFPILGVEIETGPDIKWRRDYVNKIDSGAAYFRLIPHLDSARVGDHKVIWELNRHQHLVLLAQAFLLTGDEEFFVEILNQWESWVECNSYQRGINWASALEVAFRALSWSWVYHLAGPRMEPAFRRRFLKELYRHGLHIERNLSFYFSPNTHLLGEAMALHALGVLFSAFPRARHWQRLGGRVVRRELDRQIGADGAHFEQSTYYHIYALDFFLLHYVIAGRPEAFRPALLRMAEYLNALLDQAGSIPLVGDDDGGRVFHPYGRRDRFGRATLATCAVLLERYDWLRDEKDLDEQAVWWLGAEGVLGRIGRRPVRSLESRLFPQTGTAILRSANLTVMADAGGFGPFRAGHSHSDTLSVIAHAGGEEILVDAGTCTYMGDSRWRDWFRSSAAHNTVRIDGKDQAVPFGPFGWATKPQVNVNEWHTAAAYDFLDASCRYSIDGAEVGHRRRILLIKPDVVFIVDEIEGGEGEHLVEQFWHPCGEVTALSPQCFRIGSQASLALAGDAEASLSEGGEHGWRSRAYGEKSSAQVLLASRRSAFPVVMAAALAIPDILRLELKKEDSEIRLTLDGDRRWLVRFTPHGAPEYQIEPGK